jgi:predicted glycogen debranching enzyme
MSSTPELILESWKKGDDAARLQNQEWLVTNSIGGYSSGAVVGPPLRRYHGMMVANLPAPLGRTVLVPQIEAQIKINGNDWSDLSNADASFLQRFHLDLQTPVWTFRVNDRVVRKQITMPHGQNTVYIQYTLMEGAPLELRLRPYFTARGHDQRLPQGAGPKLRTTVVENGHEIQYGSDMPPVRIKVGPAGSFVVEDRSKPVLYAIEQQRGLDCEETIVSPGYFTAVLNLGAAVSISMTVESWESLTSNVDKIFEAGNQRRQALLALAPKLNSNPFGAQLALAADQFIISPSTRAEEKVLGEISGDPKRTVIAGYHWFTDWGRDTMISLEGLTMCTGRFAESRAILRTFSAYVRNGLLPNLFPEGAQQGLYHTIDATFWFFHAMDRYYHHTEDRETLEQLFPVFESIIDWHSRGTDFGIGMDPADGLLRGGAPGYALTWMDAKYDNTVVTPRRGKPVEIQALWYNALCLMDEWSKQLQRKTIPYAEMAARVATSFNARFWYQAGQYLYDVVDGENGDDRSFRPNQLFAISFRYPLLARERWKPVFDAVTEKLLTPYGLRTLAPDDPNYRPRYSGNRQERDQTYHQGSVWTWLLGPYLDAHHKVYPGAAGDRKFLKPFESHLQQAGVGSISEIFDGEQPHAPRGCIAQAWSVAEVLRHAVS